MIERLLRTIDQLRAERDTLNGELERVTDQGTRQMLDDDPGTSDRPGSMASLRRENESMRREVGMCGVHSGAIYVSHGGLSMACMMSHQAPQYYYYHGPNVLL